MEISLLFVVALLFVAVLVIRSVVSLAVRYALFVAVALLVFSQRYGPELGSWLGAPEAVEIALVAGAAMVGTWVVATAFFRRSRWRFLLAPITGVALTALATRVIAG